MPFAQWHYHFENKEIIVQGEWFPADYISEAVDQTRGWFYTLLAISTLLDKGPAFKNVISVGHVLDAKGQKMSKSKGNVVEPMDVINEFGADAIRWYFYTINQAGEPKRFDLKDVKDKHNRFFGTLWNTSVFFETYVDKNFKPAKNFKPKHVLDRWIISLLNSLLLQMAEGLEKYDVVSPARAFEKYVENLSNWYVRRSRRRFQKPENASEKNEASQTLYFVLVNLAKSAAPFIPFISEEIYLNLTKNYKVKAKDRKESVHLCDFPLADKKMIDNRLEEKMDEIRKIAALALAERAASQIKVRQPLAKLKIKNQKLKTEAELLDILKDELNVKEIIFDEELKKEIDLDKRITKELKEEGMARELVRQIQDARKQMGLTRNDTIALNFHSKDNDAQKFLSSWKEFILKETFARLAGEEFKSDLEKEFQIDEIKLRTGIAKVN
jgi:isoleucyl-tRNA synthetase